ncbi:FGFR1 oncogene partner 2 homolog [Trichonephila clavata]|uniref:FGFR1 oncogene partner 2 homolog n=1 Tax=Trichonephila clavata TaxID=2740835 RepID=A0A8X6J4K4_TRICU|nr:FGFR1 oncogene partner 2 homolog [Trichonephila clavata]
MSVSVNQILNDAKRLVSRLREHDSTADAVISQTQTLYKNVEAMKEYNEEVNEQNVTNQIRNRPMLMFNVQQENKHIRDLLQENRELKDMLEEQQSAMELIMRKYRQQATQLINTTSTVKDDSFVNSTQELQKLADNICEIADVMKQSVKLDDVSYINEQEKLTELITENRGLRELLDISQSYGSLRVPLNSPEMADKEIQTDS